MRQFDPEYTYLADMYDDDYFPPALVDQVKTLIQNMVAVLESGEEDLGKIQNALDQMTQGINELNEAFQEADSDIDTMARECIAGNVMDILRWFHVDIDIEDALAQREW